VEREKIKIQNEALWQKGSLYVRIFPIVKTLGYDFNIFSLGSPGEGDWVFDGGLGGRLSLLRPGFYLSSTFSPHYLIFLHHPQENFLNREITGEIGLRIWKFNFYFSYSDSKEKARPSFELGPRVASRRKTHLFSVDISPEHPLSLEVVGRRDEYSYIQISGGLPAFSADRTEYTYILRLRRRIFSATRLVFSMGYRRSLFKWNEERNALHQWGEVGIIFPEISRVKGSFSLGFKQLSSLKKEGGFRFQGLKGRGNLSVELGTLLFSLSYNLDWIYSVFVADVVRVKNLRAGGGMKLVRDNFRLQGWYSRGELLFLFSSRIDEVRNYGVQFLFRVSPKGFLGVQYFWLRATSSVGGWSRLIKTIGGVVVYEI